MMLTPPSLKAVSIAAPNRGRFLLLACGMFFLTHSALGVDPLGKATLTKLSACPAGGLANGVCYKVTVSNCPESTAAFVATIQVNNPPGGNKSIGTVFFTTGGGGNSFYDNFSKFDQGDTRCNAAGNCGLYAVQTVNAAGYETVQTAFSNPNNSTADPVGWLTGPAKDGPRALACRYATLVNAVWTNLLAKDTTRPVCATGNSAGSAAIAYSLTQYGLGSPSGPGPLLSMAEATSGPPMGRLDLGCQKTPPYKTVTCPGGAVLNEDYGVGTASMFIDPAYDNDQDSSTATDSADLCSKQVLNGGNAPTFRHDSVVSDDFAAPKYPKTFVNVVFGDQDLTAAVPQGLEWYNAITSSKAQSCVVGATHEMSASYEGASQVANDLIGFCKLQ